MGSYAYSVYDDEPPPLVPCPECEADGYSECDCEFLELCDQCGNDLAIEAHAPGCKG